MFTFVLHQLLGPDIDVVIHHLCTVRKQQQQQRNICYQLKLVQIINSQVKNNLFKLA